MMRMQMTMRVRREYVWAILLLPQRKFVVQRDTGNILTCDSTQELYEFGRSLYASSGQQFCVCEYDEKIRRTIHRKTFGRGKKRRGKKWLSK